jgi:hypothetical protein
LTSKISQPRCRGLASRQVVIAHDAEQLPFDRLQPTVFPDAAIGATYRIQQVDMATLTERMCLPMQAIAAFEQGRIV